MFIGIWAILAWDKMEDQKFREMNRSVKLRVISSCKLGINKVSRERSDWDYRSYFGVR